MTENIVTLSRDDAIIEYLPLVKKVVDRIFVRNNHLEKDDLMSIGVIGLIDAIGKYDYSKSVPFEAYATLRIRGSIIDAMRKNGRVSRSKVDKLNSYYAAKEKLEQVLLRTPTQKEICNELRINDSELNKIYETVNDLSYISFESILFYKNGGEVPLYDLLKDDTSLTPENQYFHKEKKIILREAIDKLNEREKLILNLYYVEELTFKEIGYVLQLSIPRVSQIHGKILMKLRDNIQKKVSR